MVVYDRGVCERSHSSVMPAEEFCEVTFGALRRRHSWAHACPLSVCLAGRSRAQGLAVLEIHQGAGWITIGRELTGVYL